MIHLSKAGTLMVTLGLELFTKLKLSLHIHVYWYMYVHA